jgi:MFS family permease
MTAEMTIDSAAAAEARPSLRAWCFLLLGIVASLFGYLDRQVLVLLADPIKHDLGLSDGQLGLIQGLGPGVIAAFGVLLIGWLVDRTARQWVFVGAVLAWSVATALCGVSTSFWHLLLTSTAIGIGEAALIPIVLSVIPDLFPGRSRITANVIFIAAANAGSGVGMAFAGGTVGLIQAHGQDLPLGLAQLPAWRTTFLLAAAPGLPIAAAIALVGPVRRAVSSGATKAHSSLGAYLKRHWRVPLALAAATCFQTMGLFSLALWGPVYIMRTLEAPPAEVGAGIGAAVIFGSLAGSLAGGMAARWLSARLGQVAPLRTVQAAILLTLLPVLGLLLADRPVAVYVLIGLSVSTVMGGASLIYTLMQDVAPAAVRGRMLSLFTLIYTASGGIGPILVGQISDHLSWSSHGLIWAIVGVAVPCLMLAAVASWLVERPYRRTVAELAGEAA